MPGIRRKKSYGRDTRKFAGTSVRAEHPPTLVTFQANMAAELSKENRARMQQPPRETIQPGLFSRERDYPGAIGKEIKRRGEEGAYSQLNIFLERKL